MTVARFVLLIATLYIVALAGLIAWAGRQTAFGPLETIFAVISGASTAEAFTNIAMLIGGSVCIAWLGTLEVMSRNPPHLPRYLLPSFLHGLVLLAIIVAAFTV